MGVIEYHTRFGQDRTKNGKSPTKKSRIPHRKRLKTHNLKNLFLTRGHFRFK